MTLNKLFLLLLLLSIERPQSPSWLFCRYGACLLCLCRHKPPNSNMDYRIFNARTDVNACDCTWGCADTEKECALKAESGKQMPCRTGESNLRQRRDGPMLYRWATSSLSLGWSQATTVWTSVSLPRLELVNRNSTPVRSAALQLNICCSHVHSTITPGVISRRWGLRWWGSFPTV